MLECITERPEHFGPLFGYCDHQAHKLMDRRLRQYDVSPMQCRTLIYLHETEGPVNQKQLERHLMVKPQYRQRHCGPAGGEGHAAAHRQQIRRPLPHPGSDGAGHAVL